MIRTTALSKPARVILDTDTFNEIDDQFALIWSLLAPEIDLRGVTAAPFFNSNSSGPADGMERSYQEILKILAMMHSQVPAFRGSAGFMSDPASPLESEAVDFIIREAALARQENQHLYIAAIGAITNVASALLKAPHLASEITVVWLGGQPLDHPTQTEFNFRGDYNATRAFFASGVEILQYPCARVVAALSIRLPELRERLAGCGEISDYLTGIFHNAIEGDESRPRVIWDICTVAFFALPEVTKWSFPARPVWNADISFTPSDTGKFAIAESIAREEVFDSMFDRITAFAGVK